MKIRVTLRKPEYERARKRSISMPVLLDDRAQQKARQRGFATFSDYMQDLVRRDLTVNVE